MKVFFCIFFKYNTFHVGVRQMIQKLILHTILNVYPHISFMTKGFQFFRNFMQKTTNNKFFVI